MLLFIRKHFKSVLSITIAIILVGFIVAWITYTPSIISSHVNPEVITKSQPTDITVSLTVKPFVFLAPISLKALIIEQGFDNSPKTEADWLKYYTSFEKNERILGELNWIGNDVNGNCIYEGHFKITYTEAKTVRVNIVTLTGHHLFPQPDLAKVDYSITQKLFNLQQFETPLNPIKPTPLLISVTDSPITIPSDPGNGDQQQYIGIDSDNNGLRDDVQREILFLAPESNKLRAAMTQKAKAETQLASEKNFWDDERSALFKQAFQGEDCLNYLMSDGSTTTPAYYRFVIADTRLTDLIKNTDQRGRDYDTEWRLWSEKGGNYETSISPNSCTFNLKDYHD